MAMSRELLRATVGGVVIVAGGYGIMKATTPTDQQFYDSLSPALKRQVDLRRQQSERGQAYAEQLKRAQQDEESPLGPSKK